MNTATEGAGNGPELLPTPEVFYGKVPNILEGRRPPLSPIERMWLMAFDTVAAEHMVLLTVDDSYALSFAALQRSYAKMAAGCYRYLLRACRNAHRDWMRKWGRRHRRLVQEGAYEERWEALDARIDLEGVLVKLAQQNEVYAKAIRLRRLAHTNSEIAEKLGMGERQAVRIIRQAEACLHHLLGAGYRDL